MSVLIKEFNLDAGQGELFKPRYNIPPTADIPVVRSMDGQRQISLMRWGLLPPWIQDPKKVPMLNNARADTVAEKPSFRSAFKRRRCIIPASGFFEWHTDGKLKQPFLFRHPDDRPLAFAGLWESWGKAENSGAPVIESCTIITTGPNSVMEPVHDRMPVILSRNDYDTWLDPKVEDKEVLLPLLTPCLSDDIICYPVNSIVNNVRNQGEDCIEPLVAAEQGELF